MKQSPRVSSLDRLEQRLREANYPRFDRQPHRFCKSLTFEWCCAASDAPGRYPDQCRLVAEGRFSAAAIDDLAVDAAFMEESDQVIR